MIQAKRPPDLSLEDKEQVPGDVFGRWINFQERRDFVQISVVEA